MQAVILAAGKGTRMGNLTEKVPKPMLLYKGKNLICHKLDVLPDSIDEIILVVGYLKEVIIGYFGNSYKGKKITYVDMPELLGTAWAIKLCESHIKNSFIVMMGDDIYDARGVKEAIDESAEWTLTVKKFDEARRGSVVISSEGFFLGIDEEVREVGNEHGAEGAMFVNTGLYKLNRKIFNYALVKLPDKNEYGLPQTMASASHDIPIKVLYTDEWKQVTSPEDVDPIQSL